MTVVAIGADHAGVSLKETVKAWLVARGVEVRDFGTHSTQSVDYPDYAAVVAAAVSAGAADRGVLVCGTGIGMAIAANKIAGVRAAPCSDLESARLSRQHNDANVLTLGARATGADLALSIVQVWLETAFDGGRHVRRIEKIAGLERPSGERTEAIAHVEAR
jgi:ribose 5-phosphate isomerase B